MQRPIVALTIFLLPALVFAQATPPPQPPPTDTVTPAIPGVCAEARR